MGRVLLRSWVNLCRGRCSVCPGLRPTTSKAFPEARLSWLSLPRARAGNQKQAFFTVGFLFPSPCKSSDPKPKPKSFPPLLEATLLLMPLGHRSTQEATSQSESWDGVDFPDLRVPNGWTPSPRLGGENQREICGCGICGRWLLFGLKRQPRERPLPCFSGFRE